MIERIQKVKIIDIVFYDKGYTGLNLLKNEYK